MTNEFQTELDLAILADEMGWDYIPACDDAWLLIADMEITSEPTPEPAPAPSPKKPNKRSLRSDLIAQCKSEMVGGCYDVQDLATWMINDVKYAALFAGKTSDQSWEYCMGVIRWNECSLFQDHR